MSDSLLRSSTSGVFVDGSRVSPGSEACRCGNDCEFPCWQRLGIAEACSSCACPPLPEEE